MPSRIYPSARKQIDAGYFWLSIGLGLSVLLAWLRPLDESRFMGAMVIYGLFHVLNGKRNLRIQNSQRENSIERYLDNNFNYDIVFPEEK